MKNKKLYQASFLLSVSCLAISSVYSPASISTAISTGYIAGVLSGVLGYWTRTKEQREKLKRFEKAERIILVSLAIIIPLIICFHILKELSIL